MDVAAKIEKNRQALLRLVGYWLFAAALLIATNRKTLPPRISRWINGLVNAAEIATHYLVVATACRQRDKDGRHLSRKSIDDIFHHADRWSEMLDANNRLSLKTLITRLKAMRTTLKDLPRQARILANRFTGQPIKKDDNRIVSPCDLSTMVTLLSSIQIKRHHIKRAIPP